MATDRTLLAAAADSAVTVGGLFEVLGLVLVVAAVTALSRRVPVAGPILLVLVGFALSYVPGVPDYRIDPNVVLLLLLPPLLYAAAWRTSNRSLRANLRTIGLLSVGLVLFTTVVVGLVAWAVVPGLPLAAGFALGAVVAPPDAVAATAVARRTGLPRRLVSVLEGESLVNDATALTTLRVAIAALAGSVSVADFLGEFVLAAAGGAAIGLGAAWVAAQLHRRTDEPMIDVVLSLLTPFTSYLLAEAVGASGVVAVVTTGLWLSTRWYRYFTAASRTLADPLWEVIDFLLTGIVFALIGLELPSILEEVRGLPAGTVVGAAVAVTLAVVLSRPAWVFPATYLGRLVPRLRRRDPATPWQYPAVLSWAGMRGVVSLAAALALLPGVPQGNLLVFLTFVVVVATLVGQGLTLPWLIRRAALPGPSATEDALQEAAVQHEAANAAIKRLDELVAGDGAVPPDVVDRLRDKAELRGLFAWERLGSRDREPPSTVYRRLRREMLAVERAVFLRARDEGRIEEEVVTAILRELDTEEMLLSRG
ncbi:sodium/proton antiporter, CPA1 family [Geodermatophilus saharensis]|uniref:Sodium/proton antiporter, CPA1 family n=1 Tax=Geodermatophilus saharensis TaxID=1137994 RepID=A0A239E3N8_9ACTN|nr:Na+/H+ antiporter [Geodermatophilus saharensis]SNS38494.1 sodium/proton antiporter, CPA1 family [Geodermatophilus saharensis]